MMKSRYGVADLDALEDLIQRFGRDYEKTKEELSGEAGTKVLLRHAHELRIHDIWKESHEAWMLIDKREGNPDDVKKALKNHEKHKKTVSGAVKREYQRMCGEFDSLSDRADRLRDGENIHAYEVAADRIVLDLETLMPLVEEKRHKTSAMIHDYIEMRSETERLNGLLAGIERRYKSLVYKDHEEFLGFARDFERSFSRAYDSATKKGKGIFGAKRLFTENSRLRGYKGLSSEIDRLKNKKEFERVKGYKITRDIYLTQAEESIERYAHIRVDDTNIADIMGVRRPIFTTDHEIERMVLVGREGRVEQLRDGCSVVHESLQTKIQEYGERLASSYSEKIEKTDESGLRSLKEAVKAQKRLFDHCRLDYGLLVKRAEERIAEYSRMGEKKRRDDERQHEYLLETEKTEREKLRTDSEKARAESEIAKERLRLEQAKQNAAAKDAEARREKARVDERFIITIKDMKESFDSQFSKVRADIASQNENISALETEIRRSREEINARLGRIEKEGVKAGQQENRYERPYERPKGGYAGNVVPLMFHGEDYCYTDDLPDTEYGMMLNDVIDILNGRQYRKFEDRFSHARLHVETGLFQGKDAEGLVKIKRCVEKDLDKGVLREEIMLGRLDEGVVYSFIEALEKAA